MNPVTKLSNEANQPLKHSGPGMPSALIGTFGVVLFLITVLLLLFFDYTEILSWFTTSLIFILAIFNICLLAWGLILGIKGFHHKEYNPLFSILGIVFNSLILLFILVLITRHLLMKYLF